MPRPTHAQLVRFRFLFLHVPSTSLRLPHLTQHQLTFPQYQLHFRRPQPHPRRGPSNVRTALTSASWPQPKKAPVKRLRKGFFDWSAEVWFYEKVWGIARLRLKEGEEEEKRGGAGAGAGGVGEGGGEAKGVKGVDGGWEKANKVWRGRLEEVLKGMVRELIGADGKKAEAGYQKAKTGEGKEEDKGEKGNEKEKQPGKEKGKK